MVVVKFVRWVPDLSVLFGGIKLGFRVSDRLGPRLVRFVLGQKNLAFFEFISWVPDLSVSFGGIKVGFRAS